MPLSAVGLSLAAVYLGIGIYVVQDDLRHSGGGWINLRGMGTAIATAPSQLTLGFLLRKLGVTAVRFHQPTVPDFVELAAHLLLTAIVVYFIGFGLQALFQLVR